MDTFLTPLVRSGFGFAGAVLAAYALAYLSTAVTSPRAFLDSWSIFDERFKRLSWSPLRPQEEHWSFYVWSGALLIGFAVLAFHVADAFTFWVPEHWGNPLPVQGMIAFVLWMFLLHVQSEDVGAHERVKPFGLRLSSWARRGYEYADDAIEDGNARFPEVSAGLFAMEFRKGFDVRLAEEGRTDARQGQYRPENFENNAAYIRTWIETAAALESGGWHHPRVSQALSELRAAETAENQAQEKAFWTDRFGFDPDEVLRRS